MSRWFRFYGDALNDRKVQSLPPELFKAWVNLLCLACNENGKAFDLAQVAFALRLADSKAQSVVGDLLSRGLLDDTAAGLVPHNWNSRQYKSDTSNQRVNDHRKRRRNVTRNSDVTPPDTEQIQISEANASDAGASARDRLWKEGLPALMALGVKEKQARPMVGRWLKDCGDDENRLCDLILRARAEAPVEPIAWITAALTKEKKRGTTENLSAVARRLATEEWIDFGPRPGSSAAIRDQADGDAVRLLPEGGRK